MQVHLNFLRLSSMLLMVKCHEMRSSLDCSEVRPTFLSYHAHALFREDDPESVLQAHQLHTDFVVHFGGSMGGIPQCGGSDALVVGIYNPAGPFGPGMTMCDLGEANTSSTPQPFPSGQWSFFVGLNDFAAVASWLAEHRPSKVNLFIHPNTGCQYHDHMRDAFWVGQKIDLVNVSEYLTCNRPGCEGALNLGGHGFCANGGPRGDGYGACYPYEPSVIV